MSSLAFAWGAASDRGQVRSGNEDAALAEDGLYAVADGMGGHAAGEIASQVAVDALRANSDEGLVEAVRRANRAVWERAEADPSLRGMGTTLCVVALVDADPPRVDVANVGDSRVYLLRDGDLLQVTDDHSLVAELEREGRISAEEARVHPQRNILTRVLGNDLEVEVDVFPVDPLQGDRFLLCSDGLFNEVDESEITGVLARLADPQEAADELVQQANRGGGRDNITVVVVDVVDDDGRARQASRVVGAAAGAGGAAAANPDGAAGDEDADRASPAPPRAAGDDEPRGRLLTWRSALFVLVFLGIVVAAAGTVTWYARSTYFVGVDDGEVTIFQGRPGGVLWFDPTVAERTGLDLDDVPPRYRQALEAGREYTSLADARRYAANLRDEAEARARVTTTTTTVPPTTTTATGAGPAPGTPTTVAP